MIERRKPDYDLEAALEHNGWGYVLKNILNVLAEVPGEADGAEWHWVVELKTPMGEDGIGSGKFAYISGGCDYTGWD